MIVNINDINDAIETIKTENENYPIFASSVMNAEEFNYNCRLIEEQLNQLYEKIRLIEDVDTFCREYTLEKIHEKENEFREKLKIIQDVTDTYRDKNSISIAVPFICDQDIIRDRDGKICREMHIENATLIASNNIMSTALIDNISYESDNSCYNNNYSNLKNNEPGISCYSVKDASLDGIHEDIMFTLKEPMICNHISIKPINCEVENISLVHTDNIEEILQIKSGYFPETEVSALKVRLKASQFTTDSKTASEDAYNGSSAFCVGDACTRYSNEQLVKQLEISRIAADRKYNVDVINSLCDNWSAINQQLKNKNILIAGED